MKKKHHQKEAIPQEARPKPAAAIKRRPVNLLPIVLIIIIGFAIYANSLGGKFLWDDEYIVKFNTYIRNFSNIENIFKSDIGTGSGRHFGFYRPIQIVTYTIDHLFWKLNPFGYHLTNIILHILAAIAVYILGFILFEETFPALFASILFLAHPDATAVVAYISGRADSLAILFMLAAFIFYIRNLDRDKTLSYLLMMACYAIALLSKELSLILPALIIVYHYAFKRKFKPYQIISLLAIPLIYILLRLGPLKHVMMADQSSRVSAIQRLPGFFVALANYAKILVAPFGLHMEYGNRLFKFSDPRVMAGIIILAGLIFWAIKKRASALTLFSIAWFVVAILPVSNLYPINAYMAEHWLYLPAIGLFWLFAGAMNDLYKKKALTVIAVAIAVLITSFFSYLTIKQNETWKEPIPFYIRTLKYAPTSIRALNDLGRLYEFERRDKEAEELYKKAIKTAPGFPLPYNNLAVIYHNLGRNEEALALYKKALELDPYYPDALNNIAVTYCALGNNAEAIESYKRAVKAHPNFAGAYGNMGTTYVTMGMNEEAIEAYKKAIEIDPNLYEANYNIGLLYAKMGRHDDAIASYKKAAEIKPNHGAAYINLAISCYYQKQYDLAVTYCDKASSLGVKPNPAFLKELEQYRK